MKAMSKMLLAGAASLLPFVAIHPAVAAEPEKAADPAPDPNWKAPRTEWGDPDLRGTWPLDYLAQTPRVRPEQFGTRAQLTDEEYAAAIKRAEAALTQYDRENKGGTLGMGHWTERGRPLRQTSLTVEPANGRMPAATPEGVERSKTMKSSWTEEEWRWVDDFNTFDRCITRGMPSSMLPGVYNSGIQVFQSPGYVAIRLEMIHETRIIPIGTKNGPPPAAVKGWLGYSRGHWEGDTLVIETTNFIPGSPIGNTGSSPRPVPNSEQMKVTERLTPTGPNNIRYEAWIEDPVVLSAPFKLDFPWQRNDDYELFEYACHEGNIQIRGFIAGTSTAPHLVAAREAKFKEIEKTNTQVASRPGE